MKFLATVGILVVASASFAQISFIKAYGNTGYDYGRDIKQDNDSGYVITGSSSSFGADDAEAYLLKLDKNGEFLWSYNYGGTDSEWGEAMVTTHDSTYAIAGYTNSFGAGGFDFYLVRIGEEGVPIWENYYGGSDWDQAYGMIQLPDSGFVLVGDSYSFNDGKRGGYMIRTDKDGELIWEVPMTGEVESFLTDIDLDGDSIVVCGGIGDGGADSFDGYVAKHHIDGTFGWSQTIGQEYNDYFNAIQSISGFYSLGGARGYNFPDESQNMWMYRMDQFGEEVVDTIYINESLRFDEVNDIAVRDDQDYAFIGHTLSYGYSGIDNEPDMFFGKMNISFIHIAAKTYGEAGSDKGHAMTRTRDGGAVFLGDTKFYSTGGNNILIVKVASSWTYPEQVDGDGLSLIVYDDITNDLPEYLESSNLKVYPNPFSDVLNVPDVQGGLYTIYGVDGQLIHQTAFNSSGIDLSYLESGMYLLTIETKEGIYKKRIVKN